MPEVQIVSEPSDKHGELIDRLRMYADDDGYSHLDYRDTMRQAANALAQQFGDGGSTPSPTESPLAWAVFLEKDPQGFDYRVFADEHAARHCAADEGLDSQCAAVEVEPLYRASAFTASATALPTSHDWQPDGGVLRFESHPGGEAPHVHTTCAKCGARAWFLEYQWELLAKGCSTTPPEEGAIK